MGYQKSQKEKQSQTKGALVIGTCPREEGSSMLKEEQIKPRHLESEQELKN